MKKLLSFALIAALAVPAFAQGEANAEAAATPSRDSTKRVNNVWPSFFAVCEFPANPDVLGLRLTIPFSTQQENVTGIDLGLWGRSLYYQGFQVNLLRNDVKDEMAGVQVGLYNSIGSGQMLGLQVGLFNEAISLRGVQAGLVNIVGEAQGLQVGIINRAETMVGYQVGLINVIRDAELQFFPVLNIGF